MRPIAESKLANSNRYDKSRLRAITRNRPKDAIARAKKAIPYAKAHAYAQQ
jgi:hypothetical protein